MSAASMDRSHTGDAPPMPPTGVVTFLFTDVEGSTRLLLRLGDRYPTALARHHELIRSAISAAGGVEMGTAGDAVFAAFSDPQLAVDAAVAAQRSLGSADWPEGAAMRVRMGLHVGEAEFGPTGYTGITVHEAARIADAGHGGQILVSEALVAAAAAHAAGVGFGDLGAYWLKDLPDRRRLYQVEAAGLRSVFPPPRALDVQPNNLPGELSGFVGRAAEASEVRDLLADHRILTLLGPGGSGKTRLALRVARSVLGRFRDGVFFAALEGLTDPGAVIPSVLSALGAADTGGGDPHGVLVEHLQDKEMLLVLDNFEQVLPAAPAISRVLAAAEGVRVLVTSRAVLRLRGERTFEVPPMAVPEPGTNLDPGEALAYDGVALFARRSREAAPGFVITAENLDAVMRIVRRLDGLPLAIELAAARSRSFPPERLADRLEGGLGPLEDARVDLPPRQRTLAATVRWSYDLLDPVLQSVLRQLAVFAGGFTVEAAAAVVTGNDDVEVAVADLVDHSLVAARPVTGGTRYALLQTIRDYALSLPPETAAEEDAPARHAVFFADLGRTAEPELAAEAQGLWMELLDQDRDNLRAALDHATAGGDPDLGLRLAASIWRYWHGSGLMKEGTRWLGDLLGEEVSAGARVEGLTALAGLAYWKADFEEGIRRYRDALDLQRQAGDRSGEAETLYGLSLTLSLSGDPDEAERLAALGLEIADDLGDRAQRGRMLMAVASAHWMRGDLAAARERWEASLAISLEQGNTSFAASQIVGLSGLLFQDGDLAGALSQAAGALEMAVEKGNAHIQVFALDAVASYAAGPAPRRAVRLAGAADALRGAAGGGWTVESVGIAPARSAAAGLLPEAEIERAWDEGGGMGLDEAVAEGRRLLEELRGGE